MKEQMIKLAEQKGIIDQIDQSKIDEICSDLSLYGFAGMSVDENGKVQVVKLSDIKQVTFKGSQDHNHIINKRMEQAFSPRK